MLIFQVGLNKSATTSIHDFFKLLGLNSVKYVIGNREILHLFWLMKYQKLEVEVLRNYQCFTDFVDINNLQQFETSLEVIKFLKNKFPKAKFILNIRNIDEWLLSRMNHYYKYAPTVGYMKEETFPEQLKQEKKFWYRWHYEIYNLFENEPERLLTVHIEKDNSAEKIAAFLGYEDTLHKKLPASNVTRNLQKSHHFPKLPESTWW